MTGSGPSCDRRRQWRRLAVLTGPWRPADARHLRAWRRTLPFFCKKLAECGGIQHLLGQQLLQLGFLVLKLLRLASETSIPPYLAFQLYSVASEMPCLRARSPVFAPASCSRSTSIICSSVNLGSLHSSVLRPDSNSSWRKSAVAGQESKSLQPAPTNIVAFARITRSRRLTSRSSSCSM
jgi:hypothetical protein